MNSISARPPRRLYRIVKTVEPQPDDFKSNFALGKRPLARTDPEDELSISVFAELEQAEFWARRHNWKLGQYVAVLHIPPRARVQVWRSQLEIAGHHSLKGDPKRLASYVVRVVKLR
ncbi:MAG TPA: hypothetical protein VF157_07735 [Chloroflexota bacterium]